MAPVFQSICIFLYRLSLRIRQAVAPEQVRNLGLLPLLLILLGQSVVIASVAGATWFLIVAAVVLLSGVFASTRRGLVSGFGYKTLFVSLGILSMSRGVVNLAYDSAPSLLKIDADIRAAGANRAGSCQVLRLAGHAVTEPEHPRAGMLRLQLRVAELGAVQLTARDLPWESATGIRKDAEVLAQACIRSTRQQLTRDPLGRETWLFWQGINWTGVIETADVVREGSMGIREGLLRKVVNNFGEGSEVSVLLSTTLGIEDHLSDDVRDLFRQTGTMHLLVVSGFQLGIIYFATSRLAARLLAAIALAGPVGVSSRVDLHQWGIVVAVALSAGYGLLVGLSVPVFRALIYVCCHGVASIVSRELSNFRVLFVSLSIISLFEPGAVLSPSLQLTTTAVLGLMLSGVIWQKLELFGASASAKCPIAVCRPNLNLKRVFSRLIHRGVRLSFDCFAVFACTMPVNLYWFGEVCLASPLINLLAIPTFSVIGTLGGGFGLLLFALQLPLGHFVVEMVLWTNEVFIGFLRVISYLI